MYATDLANELVSGCSRTPFAITTNTDSTGAAVALANNSVLSIAILDVGTVSGTNPTMDLKIQSNTTSATTGFTDVTGATFTQVTTSQQRQIITFQLPSGHSYARVTGTVGATNPNFATCVSIFSTKKYVATSGKESGVDRSPST